MTSEQIKNRLSDQFKSSVIENENLATTNGISPHVWINELSITGD